MSDLATLVHQLLTSAPTSFKLHTPSGAFSASELAAASQRAQDQLRSFGIVHGDRVLVSVDNRVGDVVGLFAVMALGAIAVPIPADCPPMRAKTIAENCTARAEISADANGNVTRRADHRPATHAATPHVKVAQHGGGPCMLIYTSGSSGTPKGIVCGHVNVLSAARSIQQCLRYRPDDRIALLLPLSFDYGLYQLFLALLSGASLYIYPAGTAGPGMVERIQRDGITVVPSMPVLTATITTICRRRRITLCDVRLVTSTGSDFSETQVHQLQPHVPNALIRPMYGLTESKRATIQQLRPPHVHSSGQPIPGSVVVVHGPRGQLPAGEEGEVHVGGPNVMLGYWPLSDSELNSRFYTDELGGRWVVTGDRGWIDEQGSLHVGGRTDDLFKRSGMRTSVAEIEDSLLLVDGVDAACVVPPQPGRPFAAFYSGPVLPDQVREELAQLIEPPKIPEHLVSLAELPLNSNGKLDRKRLAEQVMEMV